MYRSIELGRAVVHCPASTLELWLTTSITISSLQDHSDLQQLRPAQVLKTLSSGDLWVCRGSGLHAKFQLTLRDEQLSIQQHQSVIDTLLQAPVGICAAKDYLI